jgi:hypothetical protein
MSGSCIAIFFVIRPENPESRWFSETNFKTSLERRARRWGFSGGVKAFDFRVGISWFPHVPNIRATGTLRCEAQGAQGFEAQPRPVGLATAKGFRSGSGIEATKQRLTGLRSVMCTMLATCSCARGFICSGSTLPMLPSCLGSNYFAVPSIVRISFKDRTFPFNHHDDPVLSPDRSSWTTVFPPCLFLRLP